MTGLVVWLAGLLAVLNPAPPQDVGERAFQRCAACHALSGSASGDYAGPPLGGVVGRRAGSVRGFAYSDALKAAGRDGLVWDEATLDRFIADPEVVVPGTSMPYVGGPASERRAVIAWLKTR